MSISVALVVAAGRGQRFGGEAPKQYQPMAGRPVIRHCLETFAAHPQISAVRTIIHSDDRERYDAATAGLSLLDPVIGGADRQQSVLNGLESLAPMAPERVLIHDAARPLVDAGTIDRTLAALDRAPGAIAAVPLADTVKRAAGDLTVAETLDRRQLWRAQTPQGFRYAEILAAHRSQAGAGLTDDAAVAEAAGLPVALVHGAEENLKITTTDDLLRAERLLTGAAMEFRTGTGFDVHRFGSGTGVTLCGVRVPHDRGLEGHSDADVGLHALTDAILGAVGAGDIGQHFSPSDPRWRGADSAQFLAFASEQVAALGGRIVHLDVTLICERPKVAPHRQAMVDRIAGILALPSRQVSVKATTTEGLGFTGRGEGIAAQAVATVTLPAAT
ncbi:bifunctional 2-C-methyl-D-erythritol 4-phosphate cytidylyltransferase/2-C-methyl-D-erythritol 2,4-cyclodiphosphate synthase [Rhodospirillaceae bacterium SYSU D60014]|uniref:bifunctional 2-C-methyl-D-erythritol 4-phosphate cytidylyltransferase/2-C-methyl-D-erythritol 2,4-cyclodiphosphate synthase n=1 Tax=Virgifigura deserti TaxID=2268457 RepID=UPI000E672AFA